MPALVSFDDLVRLLESAGTKHAVDRERATLEIPTLLEQLPGNLIVRWGKQPFVQLIQFVLTGVPPLRVVDVARAVVVLDNKLEVPGFGFDEDSGSLYYRMVVPALPPAGIDAEALYELAQQAIRTAATYQEAFKVVVSGADGGDILELIAVTPRPR